MSLMPKIMAPTVKEHHAQRHAALIDAAKESLLDPTIRSINFEAVGPKAGLRRNSVYLYFPSENRLALELADSVLPTFVSRLSDSFKRQKLPKDQIVAFSKAVFAADSSLVHAVLRNLESRDRDEEIKSKVKECYSRIAKPVIPALKALGLTDPEGSAIVFVSMLLSVHDVAGRVIDLRVASRRALAFIDFLS